MDSYEIVKWLHVLLFGVWLGSDYGTFLSSRFMMKPDKSIETRLTAARMMLLFDLGPRLALVLMLPLGLTLASQMGVATLASWIVPVAWAVTAVWLGLVAAVELGEGKTWREPLRRVDFVIRSIVALLTLGYGLVSVVGDGPFVTGWLAWKVLLFGAIISSGIGIRLTLPAFSKAFGAVVTQGSTPEREAAVRGAIARTYPFVGSIWIMVLVAGLLGTAKP